MTPRRARVGVAVTLVGLILLAATPAGAHGTSGPPASNFTTQLRGIAPPAPGVTVSLGPDREQLVLAVSGHVRVTVFGYQDEPYLRVDTRGVFENRRSPAVTLNRSRVPTGTSRPVHAGAAEWVRISHEPVARWHDHRVHWMGGVTPLAVLNDPDRPHVIDRWRIPIRVNGRAATIHGLLRWTPPPTAWPWWLLAAGIAGATVLTTSARRRCGAPAALAAAIGVMAITESVHLWASWPFILGSTAGRIGETLPTLATIAACIGAFVWLIRRDPWAAAPGVIIAGLFVFVSGGLADLSAFSHAYIPSRLAPDTARVVVALALGLGFGTAFTGARRLRAPRPTS